MRRISRIILLLSLSTTNAWACTCLNKSEMELVDQAQYIFVARIIAARESLPNEIDRTSAYVEADFELVESLKAAEDQMPTTLKSGFGGSDCGIQFIVGRQILVHTNSSGRISICNGTRFVVGDEDFRKDPLLESYRAYINQNEEIELSNEAEKFEEEMKRLYCDNE